MNSDNGGEPAKVPFFSPPDCEYYLVDERFSDKPICMWSGIEATVEQCTRCLKEMKEWNSERAWTRLFTLEVL